MRYSRSKPSRPARIVLVDPDPHLLQLFTREHSELDLETVTGLPELQAALDDRADLVVIDLEDPLLAHVLADDSDPKTVVTARAGSRTGAEFDGVLHRPYAAGDVRRIVQSVLGLRAESVLDLRAPDSAAALASTIRDHCRDLAVNSRPPINFEAQPVPGLDRDRERVLFAVVRDVVDQALRSPGTRRIDVVLSGSADAVLVLVINRGGDTSRVNHPAGGLGLPNIRARAAALAANVDLLAARGSGYQVTVTCPLEVEVGA